MSKRKPLCSTVRASPPTIASCSSTTHPNPKFDSSYAAVNPAGPAPRITTRIALSPVFTIFPGGLATSSPRLAPLRTHEVSEGVVSLYRRGGTYLSSLCQEGLPVCNLKMPPIVSVPLVHIQAGPLYALGHAKRQQGNFSTGATHRQEYSCSTSHGLI